MSQSWIYILTGAGFCIAGILLFQRNAFEEGRKTGGALLIIAAGIVLVSIGMAKGLKLIA